MKFPFVPRSIYDDILSLLHNERARTEELSRVIVNLKVSGASIPREPGARIARTPDQYQVAIDANKYASRSPAIRSALMDYVERETAKSTPPDKILDTLRNWTSVQRSDDDDDDDDMIAVSA